MSERETLSGDSIQRWKGVNQRTQPTLVEDGFFTGSIGLFFNTDGVIRLDGKKLAGNIGKPVFSIFQVDKIALLQTTTQLLIIPIEELNGFAIVQLPQLPQTPVVTDVSYTTLNLHAPTSYPAHTLSFRMERRIIYVDELSYEDDPGVWVEVAVDPTPLDVFSLTFPMGMIVEFRNVAINDVGSTYSLVARLQLLWAAPGANLLTYSDINYTNFTILVPAIPSALDFTILSLTGADLNDPADYTAIGGIAGETPVAIPASSLMTVTEGTTYALRMSYRLKTASGSFLDFFTGASSVTTLGTAANRRITSTGDFRITSTGDNRTI